MDNTARIEAILESISKPARYIGGEMNAVAKPWEAVAIRFAFCFPDVYEVGMSHLGMKILYEIINGRPDALCERVFAPWVDMADRMRAEGVPLFTLESRRNARDFDLLGFTLQYEMSYTTILEMLDLSGISLFSKDRHEDDPIVIAGGPCAFNPEPLSAFIDAFCIGDGEATILEMIDACIASKEAGENREACLLRMAQIDGVYVPTFYNVDYQTDGSLRSFSPNRPSVSPKIRKRIEIDLNIAAYPERMIVPFQEIIHDRIMLEVMRGCTRGCRFCQAGMLYRPIRERSVQRLEALAEKLVNATGYEEISLSSLSTGDYSGLLELTKGLATRFASRRVSLSLPSLRLDGSLAESLEQTQKVRKSSLTFAPEAGTQRLRDVINKGVNEEDLIRTCRDAFRNGYSGIKLYFMIGLPTETLEDVRGIATVAQKVAVEYFATPKGERSAGLRISVSLASFVPKAFTPFQWAAQDTVDQLTEKQYLLRDALKPVKSASFHWHDPQVSFLEACFARGDRRLSQVLFSAWKKGCRFDGWSEEFRFNAWMEAFAECGLDPAFYANRERSKDELLPWAFIDAGVSAEYLWTEKLRADGAEVTPDCRGQCNGCGLEEVCFPCE